MGMSASVLVKRSLRLTAEGCGWAPSMATAITDATTTSGRNSDNTDTLSVLVLVLVLGLAQHAEKITQGVDAECNVAPACPRGVERSRKTCAAHISASAPGTK